MFEEVYKNVWDCLKIRVEDIQKKNPFEAILPSEILRIMNQIELEHVREETEKLSRYLENRAEAGMRL